jgi:hypothetical protein
MPRLPDLAALAEDDDNEFIDLPDDPEEAFAVLQRREYRKLEHHWESNEGGSGWYKERQYVDTLLAFDEVHSLGLVTAYASPPTGDNHFADFFQDFRRHVEVTAQKIRIEAARRQKTGATSIVVLDSPARDAIHKFVEAIRERLNELNLSDNKREALFGKLNAFAAEVDRNRTRTESFYAFVIDTGRLARDLETELKPFNELKHTIDRVLDWLDKAREWKDTLPPWSNRKKVEAPRRQLPGPKGGSSLDDDIPF